MALAGPTADSATWEASPTGRAPRVVRGLLTDASGFPLTVQAVEGNKAETATMLPVINAFRQAHQLTDVTVVADAGMISEANQVALQAAGLSFILGTRIPQLPDVVREWRHTHPDDAVPDGLVLTQPWPATSAEKARGIPDRVIYYQYRHDRARRTLRGIDEQVAKAERAVDAYAPVKRNRYIQLSAATKSVNRTLQAKTRALARMSQLGLLSECTARGMGSGDTADLLQRRDAGSAPRLGGRIGCSG